MSHPQPIKPNSERDPADATPLDAARWQRLLVSHPDRDFATYVSHGLKFAFDIGHRGHRPALTARNLHSAFEHADVVDAHLEQSHGWPLLLSPFPSMCCSGAGVVPKKSGKLRLIHHLSAPAGVSVNDGIPKDLYSLQHVTIDDAINMISRLGRGTLLAKMIFATPSAFALCDQRTGPSLVSTGANNTTMTLYCLLASARPPSFSTRSQTHLSGSAERNLASLTLFTSWTTS